MTYKGDNSHACHVNQQTWPFLRYCQDIANLLLWVLWVYLATATKTDSISLQKTLMFIFMQKIKFIYQLFLEILLTSWNFVILSTLGCLATQYYQLVGNFDFYLHAKNQLDPYFLEILHFNNLAIWLVESILAHELRTRILPKGFMVKYSNNIFHYTLFPGNTNDKIF